MWRGLARLQQLHPALPLAALADEVYQVLEAAFRRHGAQLSTTAATPITHATPRHVWAY